MNEDAEVGKSRSRAKPPKDNRFRLLYGGQEKEGASYPSRFCDLELRFVVTMNRDVPVVFVRIGNEVEPAPVVVSELPTFGVRGYSVVINPVNGCPLLDTEFPTKYEYRKELWEKLNASLDGFSVARAPVTKGGKERLRHAIILMERGQGGVPNSTADLLKNEWITKDWAWVHGGEITALGPRGWRIPVVDKKTAGRGVDYTNRALDGILRLEQAEKELWAKITSFRGEFVGREDEYQAFIRRTDRKGMVIGDKKRWVKAERKMKLKGTPDGRLKAQRDWKKEFG